MCAGTVQLVVLVSIPNRVPSAARRASMPGLVATPGAVALSYP